MGFDCAWSEAAGFDFKLRGDAAAAGARPAPHHPPLAPHQARCALPCRRLLTRRSTALRCAGGGPPALHAVRLLGMGPKLLLSDRSTADQPAIRWRLRVKGNTAVEFGVVPLGLEVRRGRGGVGALGRGTAGWDGAHSIEAPAAPPTSCCPPCALPPAAHPHLAAQVPGCARLLQPPCHGLLLAGAPCSASMPAAAGVRASKQQCRHHTALPLPAATLNPTACPVAPSASPLQITAGSLLPLKAPVMRGTVLDVLACRGRLEVRRCSRCCWGGAAWRCRVTVLRGCCCCSSRGQPR